MANINIIITILLLLACCY